MELTRSFALKRLSRNDLGRRWRGLPESLRIPGHIRPAQTERSRPRPRVPRATEGAGDDSTHFTRAPTYWPASALRGRPLSAALSSPAPAARMRWWRSTDCGWWSAPTHTRPQTRKRQGAWSVGAGRGQRGLQSDVRRDDGGHRRDQLRRAARGRRGRGPPRPHSYRQT